MSHAAIIDRLGGYVAVARDLHLPKTTVHTWRSRGIPARKWPDVLALPAAQEAGIDANALLRPDLFEPLAAPITQPADAA